MKKTSLIFLSMSLLMLSHGCGSSSSTTTGGEDLSQEEQQDVVGYVLSNAQLNVALNSEFGVALIVEEAVRHDSFDLSCEVSGTIVLVENETDPTNYEVIFDECVFLVDENATFNIDAQYLTYNGTVAYENGVSTYSNFRVEQRPLDSLDVFTCTTSGTTTAEASAISDTQTSTSVTYSLTASCDNTEIRHTGQLIGTLFTGGDFFLDGTARYSLDNNSTGSGIIVTCTYSDFNVTTATCPEYTEACGLDSSTACR